jgi:mannose-6-phosphate isomerase-like protein (cupin superfamily)
MTPIRRPFWIRTLSASPEIPEDRELIAKRIISAHQALTCQMTAYHLALKTGEAAHELHAHDDGEMVILLKGRLDLLLDEDGLSMAPGSFYYNPPRVMHTVESTGTEPAVFLALRFGMENEPVPHADTVTFTHDSATLKPWPGGKAVQRQRIVDGHRLACGGLMRVDRVRMAPFAGYPLHTHDHDVLYVLLKGTLHAMVSTVPSPAMVYYAAGVAHGASPLSPDPLEMLVFEFHNPTDQHHA